MSKRLVGLDLGASGVRAVEVGPGDTPTLDRYGFQPLSPGAISEGGIHRPDEVVDALKALWRESKFKSKDVAFSVSNAGVVVRQVSLEWLEPASFTKALPYLVKDHITVPVEEVNLDYYALSEDETVNAETGEPERRVKVLLTAAKKDMIDAYVQVVTKAGLRPVRVDISPFSTIRTVVPRLDRGGEIEAIVQIGADVVNIIVHQGGLPLFVRYVPNTGSDAINQALMTQFRVTWDDAEKTKVTLGLGDVNFLPGVDMSDSVFGGSDDTAAPSSPQDHPAIPVIQRQVSLLINEVRTSLDFLMTQRDYQGMAVSRVVLTGGGARLHGLGQRMASELRLPVAILNPVQRLSGKAAAAVKPTDLDLTNAIGVCLGV